MFKFINRFVTKKYYETHSSAFDKVDDRNVPYSLFKGNNELPKYFVYNDARLTNQGLLWDTRNCCVFFGEANSLNEQRYSRGNNEFLDPIELSNIAVEKGYLDRDNGAYLINGPKLVKELGYTTGYTFAKNIEDMKDALYNVGPISVGSNHFDFDSIKKAPYVAKYKENSTGHKVIVVGYDDDKQYFILEDSYGLSRDKGRFYLPYKEFKILFPTKTINHIKDERLTLLNQYIKEAKESKKNKTSKEFLDSIVAMERGYNKMLKKLAAQIVFIKRVNEKQLLDLIK